MSDAAFDALAQRILDERWQAYPNAASGSGLHEYDGRLPALSPSVIEARVAQLRSASDDLRALDGALLSEQRRLDRELLMAGLANELFEMTEWQAYRRDPMSLMYPIEISNYMDRSYAPAAERAASMAEALRQAPDYLDALVSLLEPPFAQPVLRQSIESYEGIARFYREDAVAFIREHSGSSAGAFAGGCGERGSSHRCGCLLPEIA